MQDFSGLVILKNGDIKDTIIKPSEISGDLYRSVIFVRVMDLMNNANGTLKSIKLSIKLRFLVAKSERVALKTNTNFLLLLTLLFSSEIC